jgi:hypothetical protein
MKKGWEKLSDDNPTELRAADAIATKRVEL